MWLRNLYNDFLNYVIVQSSWWFLKLCDCAIFMMIFKIMWLRNVYDDFYFSRVTDLTYAKSAPVQLCIRTVISV